MMNKETYERLKMDVTECEAEDIITTSEPQYTYVPGDNEYTGSGGLTPLGSL